MKQIYKKYCYYLIIKRIQKIITKTYKYKLMLKGFMQRTISKDTPLAEITLRRYEKQENLSERDLVRKVCLSLGLLQPGDSRDVIIDVLYVLLKSKKGQKELDSFEIENLVKELRKNNNLPMIGVASSNIRRQLKRLRDIFIIEKRLNSYRIAEFSELCKIFEERIERFLLPTINDRIKEYLREIEKI